MTLGIWGIQTATVLVGITFLLSAACLLRMIPRQFTTLWKCQSDRRDDSLVSLKGAVEFNICNLIVLGSAAAILAAPSGKSMQYGLAAVMSLCGLALAYFGLVSALRFRAFGILAEKIRSYADPEGEIFQGDWVDLSTRALEFSPFAGWNSRKKTELLRQQIFDGAVKTWWWKIDQLRGYGGEQHSLPKQQSVSRNFFQFFTTHKLLEEYTDRHLPAENRGKIKIMLEWGVRTLPQTFAWPKKPNRKFKAVAAAAGFPS